MRILRIKQIEFALRGGRLEDAFKRLKQSSVLEHRRGQELVQELVDAFVARGRDYLQNEHIDAAAVDCDRAVDLAGQQPAVIALRREIEAASRERAVLCKRRKGIADEARSMIGRGEFDAGQEKLDELSVAASARAGLESEIERARARLAAAMKRATIALENRDDAQAAHALLDVQRIQPEDVDFLALKRGFVRSTLVQFDDAIIDGRLDRATRLLARIRPLAEGNQNASNAAMIVDLLQQASDAIERGAFADGLRLLKQCAQLVPERALDWIQSAMATTSNAAQSVDSLQTGPLSLMQMGLPENVASPLLLEKGPVRVKAAVRTSSNPKGSLLPERFLLQADGVGSYLVVRNDRVHFGPISSSQSSDVELQGVVKKANVRIDRLDEDYFLRGDLELTVNGHLTREALLADGDVIVLGKRCRGTFRRPTPTTGTAMFEFSATSFRRRDVRGILLLDDAILIGPGQRSHVRAGDTAKPGVLFMRGETLCYRDDGETMPIGLGSPFRIGETSIVCTKI